MKKIVAGNLFIAVMIFAAAYTSHAEMRGCMGRQGNCMYDEGMSPMRGMRGPGLGMMGEGHPLWRRLAGLGLDEKQREAIDEIMSKVMKETIRKKADQRIAHLELRDLLGKEPVDMKAAEAKLKQIEAARTDIHLSFIKAMEQAKTKLTPEQREKFRAMPPSGPMRGGREMMGGKRTGRMGMPPPPSIEDQAGEREDIQTD